MSWAKAFIPTLHSPPLDLEQHHISLNAFSLPSVKGTFLRPAPVCRTCTRKSEDDFSLALLVAGGQIHGFRVASVILLRRRRRKRRGRRRRKEEMGWEGRSTCYPQRRLVFCSQTYLTVHRHSISRHLMASSDLLQYIHGDKMLIV